MTAGAHVSIHGVEAHEVRVDPIVPGAIDMGSVIVVFGYNTVYLTREAATRLVEQLLPHVDSIDIAGSLTGGAR